MAPTPAGRILGIHGAREPSLAADAPLASRAPQDSALASPGGLSDEARRAVAIATGQAEPTSQGIMGGAVDTPLEFKLAYEQGEFVPPTQPQIDPVQALRQATGGQMTMPLKSASWDRSSRQMDDKNIQAVQRAQQKLAAAEQRKGEALAEREQNKLNQAAQEAEAYGQQQVESMRIAEENRKRNEAYLQQYAQEAEKIDATLKPNRLWSNMNVFQKASYYLASALSGMLNPTGVNDTVEIFRGMVRDDLETQMKEYEQKKGKVEGKWNVYKAFRELGNDKVTAAEKAAGYMEKKYAALAKQAALTNAKGINAATAEAFASKLEADFAEKVATTEVETKRQGGSTNEVINPAVEIAKSMIKSPKVAQLSEQQANKLETLTGVSDQAIQLQKALSDARQEYQKTGDFSEATLKQVSQQAHQVSLALNRMDKGQLNETERILSLRAVQDLDNPSTLKAFIGSPKQIANVGRWAAWANNNLYGEMFRLRDQGVNVQPFAAAYAGQGSRIDERVAAGNRAAESLRSAAATGKETQPSITEELDRRFQAFFTRFGGLGTGGQVVKEGR